jgi:hypothetical protein
VAAGAKLFEGGPVGVLVAIAATAETKTFPFFLPVTFGTVHLAMGSLQGVSALIVVKNDLPERRLQAVTPVTVRSQLPFMNIRVAGGTPGVFE